MRRAIVLTLIAVGCSAPPLTPDAGSDAGAAAVDASEDAGAADAGSDAGMDAGSDAGCATDLQCPIHQRCTAGACTIRAAAIDGGFACAHPCDCRQGEWCVDARCTADPITATRFLTSNDDLASALTLHPFNEVFALRANDTFSSDAPFRMGGPNLSVVGGYRDCAPGRWVRDPDAGTTLSTDAGTVLTIGTSVQRDGHRAIGLDLLPARCDGALVVATNTFDLALDRLQPALSSCDAGLTVISCDGCNQARLTNIALPPLQLTTPDPVTVIHFARSSGVIAGTRVAATPGPSETSVFLMVRIDNPSGLVTVRDAAMGSVIARETRGVSALGAAQRVDVRSSTFAWPRSPLGTTGQTFGFDAISLGQVDDAVVADNLIDGSNLSADLMGVGHAITFFLGSRGMTIRGNVIRLPTRPNQSGHKGIEVSSFFGPLVIADNRIEGGSNAATTGIEISGPNPNGASVRRNDVDVRGTITRALSVSGHTGSVVAVEDNRFHAVGNACTTVNTADFENSRIRADRNRISAIGAGAAVRSEGGHLALSSSVLEATGCLGPASALEIAGEGVLLGNTLIQHPHTIGSGPTRGIWCQKFTAQPLTAIGNIIDTGRGADHAAVFDTSSLGFCFLGAQWKSNVLWTSHPSGQLQPSDRVNTIVQADAGSRDSNNNLFNLGVSCFADAGTYRLATGSACVDTGELLFTTDGGLIELDVDRQSRLDAGLPDVGAFELH